MIKSIIFDWGGVHTKGKITDSFCRTVSRRTGIPYSVVEKEFERYNDRFLKGRISGKEFFDSFAKNLGIKKDAGFYIKELISSGKSGKDLLELEKMLGKNYNIGLISDNYKELADWIEKKYMLEKVFDVIVFSNRVRTKKPGARIFRIALKRLGVKPSEAVFIDDKLRNVKAARSLGMQAVVFTNSGKLKKKLIQMGIRGIKD